jgi:hypothetical protein
MNDKPTLFIVGKPTWKDELIEQLPDFVIRQKTEEQAYITALIETQAALILIDGASDNCSLWVSSPKVSPATRRIPIIVITNQADLTADALLHGADGVLSAAELLKDAEQVIKNYARLPDPERMTQLDCDCQEELPELAKEAVRQFNAGEYYQQHDLFEALWMKTASPVRDLYRAVLQVGIAYYQIERGNYRGALKILQRSVQWLIILPNECQGIDVKQLREDSFRVRAELERLGEARFIEFDTKLLHNIKMLY